MKIEVEFWDGSIGRYTVDDIDDAWRLVRYWDDNVKSVWRDDEPWLGDCTDMDKP